MNYLRRNHPVHEIRLKGFEKPFKSISIDDKLRPLNSKKYIVNLLFQEIEYSEKLVLFLNGLTSIAYNKNIITIPYTGEALIIINFNLSFNLVSWDIDLR